jgi:uncharacterized protein YacL (UPF0231 family)
MVKANKGKTLMMMAVMMLSLAFSGFAHAAALKTMKSDSGMELFHLRQASEMYGYSIEWNDMERSVTLVYMDKMDDTMMGDDSMMQDDKMMKPAAKMITLWIDSKEIMIDGMKVTLDSAPTIYDGSTYVVEALITKYMKPAMAMN